MSASRAFYMFLAYVLAVVVLVVTKCPPILIGAYILGAVILLAIKGSLWWTTVYNKRVVNKDKVDDLDAFEDDIEDVDDFKAWVVAADAAKSQTCDKQEEAVNKFDVIMKT